MASFGWKRKVGERVSKAAAQQFEAEAEQVETGADREDEVDWLHAIKKRREVLLEDCATKSKRLKDEGATLAEQGRHWEAIKKWDEAIQLTPENPLLYEMKSQVLTMLQEVFPAVQAAEMVVKLRPLWWEGWQTLGRAQLSLGELDLWRSAGETDCWRQCWRDRLLEVVLERLLNLLALKSWNGGKAAVRSFQMAVHLCPSELPLWSEDLAWARQLQQRRRTTQERKDREEEARQEVLHAPELREDYDFESDEVLAACAAVAERQRRYEELKRTAVVVDVEGNAREVPAEEDAMASSPSEEQFVKARGP